MSHLTKAFLVLALLAPAETHADTTPLTLTWGLDRPYFYQETTITADEFIAGHIRKSTDKRYRFFSVNANDELYSSRMLPLSNRALDAWKIYRSKHTDANQKDFIHYLNLTDPYVIGSFRDLAPVLYFDFMGSNKSEYVLQAIEVTTIEFDEYMGGGFSDKEAWYDIILSTTPGTKRYDVSSKLRFSGSGRADLRLFSGNFYPAMGTAPMGRYKISIIFHFLVDGNHLEVGTGPFYIDV